MKLDINKVFDLFFVGSWGYPYILFSLWFLVACAGTRLKLHEWTELPKEHYTIPPYAHYLSRFKIALDPGHGGMAHLPDYKRGPTGKREAIMNLNVARFLKEFLQLAGAQVILTRQGDEFVSLQDRVEIAEKAGCDFIISLHHNFSKNPSTNFAAVFYHLYPDYSPLSMDLARNIYFGLVEALHLPQISIEGLLSDKLIYPAGFGLLRRAKIPAILVESSFYSNPREEKRLMDWRYNRREAYGIFLGLARWAAGGIPRAERVEPQKIARNKRRKIVYRLYDGLEERGGRTAGKLLIFAQSVTALIDSMKVPVKLSEDLRYAVFVPDSGLNNGLHFTRLNLQNLYKNHNFPKRDTLIIASPTDSIYFQMISKKLPADTQAVMPVTLSIFDKDGEPVWDGTRVKITVDQGTILADSIHLNQGKTTIYYRAPQDTGTAHIKVQADWYTDSLQINIVPRGQLWVLSGQVVNDSTGAPINGVSIFLDDSLLTQADVNGYFFILKPTPGIHQIKIQTLGYTSKLFEIQIDPLHSLFRNISLQPNLGGILHGETIIIDPDIDTLNTQHFKNSPTWLLARALFDTLRWAGALPVLLSDPAHPLTLQQRIKKVNALPQGWYLKIKYETWDRDSLFVQTTIYPANRVAEQIATAILKAYTEIPKTHGILLQNTDVPEVTLTNKTALELVLRCRTPEIWQRDLIRLFRAIIDFKRQQNQNSIPDSIKN
ncbi:MAG: hypothetical protein D6813_14930 [Calditrichaeota bacterium]|nr:MAG: hypothetical protein D6813_14930 [Calditrichota bacterium]